MLRQLFSAFGLIAIIVASEYLVRHYAIFWIPVLGRLRVNDMLVSGAAYSALVWLTMPAGSRSFAVLRQTAGEIWGFIRNRQVQIAAALALGAGWLAWVDRFLWGEVRLSILPNPWGPGRVLFEPLGLPLAVISLLVVNGVVVPLAEEWLWRGLIQPRLAGAFGYLPGLVVTSVTFSLKHAVVDSSLGHLLTLTAFGLVMGVTARHHGWRGSAMAHALANTIATVLGLILTGGQL